MYVVGPAITTTRLMTASDTELPRVIGEEAGGYMGGAVGTLAFILGCAAAGVPTAGIGTITCVIAGGVVGGAVGSYTAGKRRITFTAEE